MQINYGLTGSQRKELVTAIGNFLGVKPKYAGMPTCTYQIGEYTVTKDGDLVWDENTTDATALVEELQSKGYEEANVNQLVISVPKDSLDADGIQRLQNLVDSKGSIMKHAFGKDELKIEVDEEKISFPWCEVIDADHFAAYSQFVTAIVKMANEQKRILNREKDVENEKYAFRCFLLRLGFIGDEYKKTRKILLENLSGSAAFKTKKEASENDTSE